MSMAYARKTTLNFNSRSVHEEIPLVHVKILANKFAFLFHDKLLKIYMDVPFLCDSGLK
jgi:hypothetical protein